MGWFSRLFKKIFSWIVVIVAIVAVVIVTVVSCGAGIASMSGFLAGGMAGLSSATFMGLSLGQCMLIVMVAGFSAICLLQVAVGLVGGATEVLAMADASLTEVDAPEVAAYEPTAAGAFVKRLSVTDDTITEVEFVLGREGDEDVVVSSEVEDGFYADWLSAQAVALAAQADLLVRTGQAANLEVELSATIAQLEVAEADLVETIAALTEAEGDVTEAEAQLAAVRRQLTEVTDLVTQLRAANAAVHSQLDAASEREQALLQQLAASETDALSLGEALAVLTGELTEQAEANAGLTGQLAELISRNEAYQQAITQLNADSLASQERWATALEAQRQLTAEAQTSAAALAAQIALLEEELDQLDSGNTAEREQLQERVSTLTSALNTANKLRVNAERGLEYANSELVSLRSLAVYLQEQLDAADQSELISDMRAAVAEYDALLTKAQSDIRNRDELSQALASQLGAATNRIAQLMARAELDQQATQLLSNQVNAAAQAAATYQATLAQRDMENAALRDYVDNLSKQLARLSQVTPRTQTITKEHDKGVVAAAAVAALAITAAVLDE